MVSEEEHLKGIRCRGMCNFCYEKEGCYQGKIFFDNVNQIIEKQNLDIEVCVDPAPVNKEFDLEKDLKSKPPLGVTPKNIWLSERFDNLKRAITMYTECNLNVPVEWIEEYNELVSMLEK